MNSIKIVCTLTALSLLAACKTPNESETEKNLHGKWTEVKTISKCSNYLDSAFQSFTYDFVSTTKVIVDKTGSHNYKIEGDSIIWNPESKDAISKDHIEFSSDSKITLTRKYKNNCLVTSFFEKDIE